MRQHELTELALILLADGYSRRFGQNKLLYPVNGKPMYSYGLDTLKKAAWKRRSPGQEPDSYRPEIPG